MKRVMALAALLLPGAAPATDGDVLRAVLADAAAERWSYCVRRALDEAPFAGIRRDLAFEDEVQAIPPAASAQRATPAERLSAIRERVASGWIGDAGAPLAPALLERIVTAAVVIAERGDPRRLRKSHDTVAELNTMGAADTPTEPVSPELAAQADALESTADAAAHAEPPPADHGRIDPAWLVHGQRLADRCPNPSLSLSAIAREGDLAFVDVGRVWAPLAGVGETWVMQRTAGGWRRIARRRTWIS